MSNDAWVLSFKHRANLHLVLVESYVDSIWNVTAWHENYPKDPGMSILLRMCVCVVVGNFLHLRGNAHDLNRPHQGTGN